MDNNSELFADVKMIILTLMSNGFDKYAVALEDALHISTVPGEILGEVRLVLREIPNEVALALNLSQKIKKALNYLDHIL